jgi:SAM-dependent methyltransferase
MTLFALAEKILAQSESLAREGSPLVDILEALRSLSLEDFGLFLISLPNNDYPNLSGMLPRMAPDEVQVGMTGSSGLALFAQTASFARILETAVSRHTNRNIRKATILDLGVGYGRNIRSMLYFSDPDKLWGLDPWPQALEHSRVAGIPAHLKLSDTMPVNLPVGDTRFDLAFSFSVFTHLSPTATIAAMKAVRKVIKPGGIFVCTIRPIEFWKLTEGSFTFEQGKQAIHDHKTSGYAFIPASWSDGSYGDASIDPVFFNQEGWEVASYETSLSDPYQVSIVLKPVTTVLNSG